jgi:hypothetical protein
MGKKGGGNQTQTTVLDPQTRAYVEWMRQQQQDQYGRFMGAGGDLFAGPHGAQTGGLSALGGLQGQAGDMFGMGQQAAQRGMMFNPHAAQQRWMNPYQQQVIDAMQPQFQRQMANVGMQADQMATQAGAFGGSRHAIMEGAARARMAEGQNQQVANLLSQGFGQSSALAMQQGQLAQNQANLGFGAMGQSLGLGGQFAGQQYGMGAGLRDIQNQILQQELYRMQQGLGMIQNAGPFGQTQTSQGAGGNPLGAAFGGAVAGSALGPVGTGIGAGLGLFGFL